VVAVLAEPFIVETVAKVLAKRLQNLCRMNSKQTLNTVNVVDIYFSDAFKHPDAV